MRILVVTDKSRPRFLDSRARYIGLTESGLSWTDGSVRPCPGSMNVGIWLAYEPGSFLQVISHPAQEITRTRPCKLLTNDPVYWWGVRQYIDTFGERWFVLPMPIVK